jgi:5-oxoprolinase (ATP-hydrolysing) subunit C
MSLRVLHPGAASRLVDAGRPSTRALGVPVGGAADRASLALGNVLVGNEPSAAALEVALAGPRLRAEADLACVVYGAPFDLAGPDDVRLGKTFALRAGAELRIAGTERGLRAYLCVAGGFHSPVVLGSRSALECVRPGDVLPCSSGHVLPRFLRDGDIDFGDAYTLRVLPGSQAAWFCAEEFYAEEFIVAAASNRMGLRLEGRPLAVPARELVSEPVAPGAVQVTRAGQCIILGVDGQTIGGYPKIAHVIRADLDLLGQLRPGTCLRFTEVSLQEACELDRQAQARLRERLLRVRLSLDGFDTERTLRGERD